MEEPRVIGNWTNISNLGSGGFGVVTLWENGITKEKLAIKKCRWYMPDKIPPNQRRRWTQEVEMLRESIRHVNIAAYKPIPQDLHVQLERYNHSKLPLLSMEYCTRGNLRHFLNKQEHKCGLPEQEVRHLLKDLSAGVAYLHRLNITHRDIKPDNVVLQTCDDRPLGIVYKIIDLGYAKELGSQVASFVGTLPYLAPEIFQRSSYTKNVDYWSFGILTFEVICGKHPFLPKLEPVQRFDHLQKKTPNHICLYTARNGEIIYSEELLPEHHINPVLKAHVQTWLRSMLLYEPSERGNGINVFRALNEILDKKILTVFSVYDYRYFYYEIGNGVNVGMVKEWLEKDCGIAVNEQVLITEGGVDVCDVSNGLDECDSQYWILFKLSHFIRTHEQDIPPTVKNFIMNNNKEYTWNVLYEHIAKNVHYIHKETTLMTSLQKSTVSLYHYVNASLENEARLFAGVKTRTEKILTLIEVYNHLNAELRDFVVRNGAGEKYTRYKQTLWKSRDLVENFNAVIVRHGRLQAKRKILSEIGVNLEGVTEENSPGNIYKNAMDCMIISNHPTTVSSQGIIKVLSACFQKRYKMFTNTFYLEFVTYTSKVLRAIQRLTKWMNALNSQMEKVSVELTEIHTEILKHIVETGGQVTTNRRNISIDDIDINDLMEDNRTLRYNVQGVMNQLLQLSISDVEQA